MTDVTPFYGEAGGQVGDRGVVVREGGADALRGRGHAEAHPGHRGAPRARSRAAACAVGDVVNLEVDHALRTATRRNHSATHLLHWALRTVLGEQATQKGSLVGPDRLRFDFAYGKALTTRGDHRASRIS